MSQSLQIFFGGVPHNRNNQAAVETDRNSDIDITLVYNRVPVKGGIYNRKLSKSPYDGLDEERCDGETNPCPFELRFEFFTALYDAGANPLRRMLLHCAEVRRLATICSAMGLSHGRQWNALDCARKRHRCRLSSHGLFLGFLFRPRFQEGQEYRPS
jgi:hypothetical protein